MYDTLKTYRETAPRKPRKWNVLPAITSDSATPQFAARFPTSATGHDYSARVLHETARMAKEGRFALQESANFWYGDGGTWISGGFYQHWPQAVKSQIREETLRMQTATDAARAHERAAWYVRRYGNPASVHKE